jgi:Uma2 family endonuclease
MVYHEETQVLQTVLPSNRLTYADLERLPESSGVRFELFDGELYVTPSPSVQHQRVSARLFRILDDYFRLGGRGEVFHAPTDVVLTDFDVAVPDLVVVTNPDALTRRAIEAAPALIVEILSPSTRRRDLALKMERYAALGVSQYWVIDPLARWCEVYRRRPERGVFARVIGVRDNAAFEAPEWPGLRVRLGDLWA